MEILEPKMQPDGLKMKTDATHFALALKTWRLRRGLTQRAAASAMGISRHSLLRVENAREVSWEIQYRILAHISDDLR